MILMLHTDCGAYGGLELFGRDHGRKQTNHHAELRRAASFLRSEMPGLEVTAYYVDFEGVWEAEVQEAIGAGRG